MTDFLSLFTLFCSSDLFAVILEVFVPVVLVACCLCLIGMVLHGKFV